MRETGVARGEGGAALASGAPVFVFAGDEISMSTRNLQREIEACAARLSAHPLLAAAQSGAVPPHAVAQYLSSVLHLVRHTPLHLALARDSAEQRGEHALAAFFRHKLAEEHGHDQWAEADLRAMGTHFGSQHGVRREPCRAIVLLIAELERAIQSAPASYLSYILFAEYITVLMGPVWVDALREHCGVPAQALSVVSRHADLDREHVAECVAEFDALLSSSDSARTLSTLRSAMAHFEAFCDELYQLARPSSAA